MSRRIRDTTLAALTVSVGLLAAARADHVEVVAGGKTGAAAELRWPFGVASDRAGNLYVVEYEGHRLRKVDPRGGVTTVAGTGKKGFGGDGGPAIRARLSGPHGLAVTPGGDVYVADTWNCRVRRIDARSGVITTLAGTGRKGFGGDGGPAARATFGNVYAVALDPRGERLYVADLDNRRVRAVDLRTGVVTTVAGNGKRGVPEDGADARAAPLLDPRAVAADAKGSLYILERGGHALRVVDRQGRVRTVAGTGRPGFSGDGGEARKASLRGPKHLAIDAEGNVLIADGDNHVIRKYLPARGTIVRVAGTGKQGSAGVGGPAGQCQLSLPHGVYAHPSGDIYIADSGNGRVLCVKH
jgi:DNA-binding beta-propeller fold protein YncE